MKLLTVILLALTSFGRAASCGNLPNEHPVSHAEAALLLTQAAFKSPWILEFKKSEGRDPFFSLIADDSLLHEAFLSNVLKNKKIRHLKEGQGTPDFIIRCSKETRERLIKRRREKFQIIRMQVFRGETLIWEGEYRTTFLNAKG